MGIKLENVAEEKAKSTAKKKLPSKVVTQVDNTPADVVKYVSEGRDLYFGDGEEFLELPAEAYKVLPQNLKVRYDMAKRITLGDDVVDTVDSGIKGFKLPFEVRPESAGAQLAVRGKKKGFDYHWARPDKFEKHLRDGWVVDHDESTSTKYDESCSYKTVGGQKSPELILLKRPKKIGVQKKADAKKRRDMSVQGAQNDFRQSAESLGVKPLVDETNG